MLLTSNNNSTAIQRKLLKIAPQFALSSHIYKLLSYVMDIIDHNNNNNCFGLTFFSLDQSTEIVLLLVKTSVINRRFRHLFIYTVYI